MCSLESNYGLSRASRRVRASLLVTYLDKDSEGGGLVEGTVVLFGKPSQGGFRIQ